MMTVKLTTLAGGEQGCAGGACPTLYQGSNGRFYVQGYRVDGGVKEVANMPKSEDLVEIPAALVEAIKALR